MKLLAKFAEAVAAWGPWGVLLLAFLDSAGVPLPDIVDFVIVLVASQHASAGYLSAALAVAGSVAGCMFLFYLGRKGGEAYLDARTRKGWARRFRNWFHHYGGVTVFIPALLPIPLPLKIFVLSAGALGMRRDHFALVVLAARIPRYFGLAYLGTQMGMYPVGYVRSHAWELTALGVGLFVVLLALVKVMERLRQRARQA